MDSADVEGIQEHAAAMTHYNDFTSPLSILDSRRCY
jgi:hypothetical protein